MDEIKPIKPEPPKEKAKAEERSPKGAKPILVERMGEQTKCSKDVLKSFLDAGWKEVK
jgi:hypothetical protein